MLFCNHFLTEIAIGEHEVHREAPVLDEVSEDISMTSEVVVSEIENRHKNVPHPRNLRLDRQLTNSILIGWATPDGIASSDIQAYHVYVDGDFKTSVKGSERTKALVEGVHKSKVCWLAPL